MIKLGYRIYVQLRELGLTQAQLSELSGLSQQIISNYVNNKFKPGYDSIIALSQALKVTPAWFFGEEEAVPTGDIIAFGKVQRGDTLEIGHFLPVENLPLPVSLNQKVGLAMNLYRLMFDTLVHIFALGGPKGGIAYNWKQNGNYWLFNLFSGVTFHSGQNCTAEDVEYSYQRWMSDNAENNPIQTVQSVDSHTVLLGFKKEYQLSDIPMPFIVPKGFYDVPDDSSGKKDYHLVGTGPFKVLEMQPDFWRLQAHKEYHRGRPFLDEVVIRHFQSPQELENALINKQIHLAIGIELEDEHFNVQAETTAQRYELVFRLDSPLCQDVRFREAIYYGLDKAAIALAAGIRNPLFAKGAFDYVLDELSELPEEHDIQKAKQLLSEISDISETRLSFEISSVNPKAEKIVQEIISQLSELGIQSEIVQDKADAAVVLLITKTPSLERCIWQHHGKANVTNYYNPSVEKMLNRLTDTAIDTALLKQIQSIILEDCPSVPLFYDEWPISYVKNLRALENRMILMTMLNDIHTWYFESEAESVPFSEMEKIDFRLAV